jgi:hypothetical protein
MTKQAEDRYVIRRLGSPSRPNTIGRGARRRRLAEGALRCSCDAAAYGIRLVSARAALRSAWNLRPAGLSEPAPDS